MATTTENLLDGLGGKGFYAKSAGLAQKAIKDQNGDVIDTTYAKTADLPQVDSTYNPTSDNAQSGKAVAQALSGTGQVPTVGSADDGKVLKATYSDGVGSFAWASDSSGMPSPVAADVGKVLGVTNAQGTMAWVDQTPAQVQSDWDETNTSSKSYIANKPNIPTVNDGQLSIKVGSGTAQTFTANQAGNTSVVIPEATTTVAGIMTSADKAKLDGIASGAQANVQPDWNAASGTAAEILNKPSLATVATTGDYTDLTNRPTVPTKTSDLTNDSSFITSAEAPIQDVKVNGSTVVDEHGVAVITIPSIPTIPVTDVTVGGQSVVSQGVAAITMPSVDQTYDGTSANAQSGVAVASAISGKQDTISDLNTIRNGAAAGATAVQPGALAAVATSGSYADLQNKPTIPSAAKNSQVTIDMAGTSTGTNRSVGVFTVDQSAASTISIPTAASGTKTGDTYTTHASPGVMSYTDKENLDDTVEKLAGIETGAEVNEIQSISVNGTAVSPDANRNVNVIVPVTHMLAPVEVASDGWYLVDIDDISQAHITYTQLVEWMTKNDTVYLQDDEFLCRVDSLVVTSGQKSVSFVGSSNVEWHFEANNDYVYYSGEPFVLTGVNGISVNGTVLPIDEQDGTVDIRTSDLAADSPTGKFLKDDGTWDVPAGKTYTAGSGIAISNQDVLSVKTDGSTIHTNASGELEVIGGGGGGGSIDGVKLEGAASALTPDANQVVTIPNAVATGETGATNGLMTADDKKAIGKAVQYVENPYEQSSPKNLVAQQMFVVENDQQIIDIVTQQSSLINGKGTLFFRITGI